VPDEVDRLIEALDLVPLPIEGGRWAQSWRDDRCSAIYYLLVADEFSALHRLAHLEIYAYHAGAPLVLMLLDPDGPDGGVSWVVLGPDVAAGQRPQVAVPPGVWQGSQSMGAWSLVGTVVVPPYTDGIVEFAVPEEMAARYPDQLGEIRRLCREIHSTE
jgi:uncharacterized protein